MIKLENDTFQSESEVFSRNKRHSAGTSDRLPVIDWEAILKVWQWTGIGKYLK